MVTELLYSGLHVRIGFIVDLDHAAKCKATLDSIKFYGM